MSATLRADAEALFVEASRQMQAGEAGAEAGFRRALALAPDLAEAWVNLGLLLEGRGEPGFAEICYRQAIEHERSLVQAWLNLGALLTQTRRLAEAEEACRRALELAPHSPAGWINLGVLEACRQRDEEAESCYRTALALEPGHANARFNLAYLLLRQGGLTEGWACLEARDWYRGLAAHLPFARWQGEPLAGQNILIGIEAGHGDMIQFCRYAPRLKAAGATRVGILCHPGLKALFATLDGVDTAIALGEPIAGQWDFWVPPLSLPFLFQTRLDTIPARLPYLAPPADRRAKWADRALPEGLKVGLVWRGNPRFENDAERSLPSLATLAPLWRVAGAGFVSLQKGAGEDEASSPPPAQPLLAQGQDFGDFADTAALIARLDLVIAVDTGIAHLAGALGVPCWILLPSYKPDWRWLTARSDSPWYPGVVRLFRRQADWADTVEEVAAALEEFVRSARER